MGLQTEIAKIMWDFKRNCKFNGSANKWDKQILTKFRKVVEGAELTDEEAKDTVIDLAAQCPYWSENDKEINLHDAKSALESQAEISFKAGAEAKLQAILKAMDDE